MKRKVNVVDVIEILEEKIILGSFTDEEYGLYIDFRKHGRKVFRHNEYREVVRGLIEDYKTYYKEGDYV